MAGGSEVKLGGDGLKGIGGDGHGWLLVGVGCVVDGVFQKIWRQKSILLRPLGDWAHGDCSPRTRWQLHIPSLSRNLYAVVSR